MFFCETLRSLRHGCPHGILFRSLKHALLPPKVQMDFQAWDSPGCLAAPALIPTFLLTWLRLDIGDFFLFPRWVDLSGKKKELNNQESDRSWIPPWGLLAFSVSVRGAQVPMWAAGLHQSTSPCSGAFEPFLTSEALTAGDGNLKHKQHPYKIRPNNPT